MWPFRFSLLRSPLLSAMNDSLGSERWGVPVQSAGESQTRNYPSLNRAQATVLGAFTGVNFSARRRFCPRVRHQSAYLRHVRRLRRARPSYALPVRRRHHRCARCLRVRRCHVPCVGCLRRSPSSCVLHVRDRRAHHRGLRRHHRSLPRRGLCVRYRRVPLRGTLGRSCRVPGSALQIPGTQLRLGA